MPTRIGIMAEIGLDGRGFQAGLMSAEKRLDQFANRMGRRLAGLFSIAAIGHQIKQAIDEAGKIRDMAQSLGMTTDQFQELEFAAKQSGATIEDVAGGIRRLAQAQKDALQGGADSPITKTFERLGVSMESLRTKSPQMLFRELARSVNEGKTGVQNMADFLDVLGRNGTVLIPAMASGFNEMANQARAAGVVIQSDIIDRLATMGDELDFQMAKWKAFRASLVIGGVEGAGNLKTGALGAYAWISSWLMHPGFKGSLDKANQAWEAVWEQASEDAADFRDRLGQQRAIRDRAAALGLANATEIAAAKANAVKAIAFKPSSDELARIGGFIGGTGTAVSIAREQLTETKALRREVVKISGFATSQF